MYFKCLFNCPNTAKTVDIMECLELDLGPLGLYSFFLFFLKVWISSYQRYSKDINVHNTFGISQLLLSINLSRRVVRDPVEQHAGESPLEQDGDSLDQVVGLFPLFLASMAGQSTAKFAELFQGNLVPAPQRLRHDGDESNPLLPAQLLGNPALVVVGHSQGMTRSRGCPSPGGILEGMCDRYIQSSIQASCPVVEENISWAAVVAR